MKAARSLPEMNLLVIGDVHGCYFTLQKLVEEHWNPEDTTLVQAGDLVNKGLHSAKCIKYWRKLEKKYPDRVHMIMGNHERKLAKSIKNPLLFNTAGMVRLELLREEMSLKSVRKWLERLPLKWENEYVLVTHAGISKKAEDPYKLGSRSGVLHNKGPLKRLDKIQVKGHSIVEGHRPVFNTQENAWYIDTGAWARKYLSAIRFSALGKEAGVVRVATLPQDRKVK